MAEDSRPEPVQVRVEVQEAEPSEPVQVQVEVQEAEPSEPILVEVVQRTRDRQAFLDSLRGKAAIPTAREVAEGRDR